MNIVFWFMIAIAVIGLLRIPKAERSGARFRVVFAALCVALGCAAILQFA
jgi:hypothetical protein